MAWYLVKAQGRLYRLPQSGNFWIRPRTWELRSKNLYLLPISFGSQETGQHVNLPGTIFRVHCLIYYDNKYSETHPKRRLT